VETLIDRNRHFAKRFDHGDLTIVPRIKTLIVTCLDSRVDPTYFLGLELGDATVMRNIGGRVTEQIVEQIAILRALIKSVAGGSLDVAIIHHTDCGVFRFADPQVRQRLGLLAGTGEGPIEKLAVVDPEVGIAEDLSLLRAASILPDELVVSGYLYDVKDGNLRETLRPAPLRKS
jgi:carbonic anhydrase